MRRKRDLCEKVGKKDSSLSFSFPFLFSSLADQLKGMETFLGIGKVKRELTETKRREKEKRRVFHFFLI